MQGEDSRTRSGVCCRVFPTSWAAITLVLLTVFPLCVICPRRGRHLNVPGHLFFFQRLYLHFVGAVFGTFTLRKLECFGHALVVNTLAWNNKIRPVATLLVCVPQVMINRDSWDHSCSIDRCDILGFVEDELQR